MGVPYADPTNANQWSDDLLYDLGDPVNATDVANIERVIGAESGGNQAGFLRDNNPWNLNTYASSHDSLPGGAIVPEFGIYVQTFPTAAAGAKATATQIEQSPALTSALAADASPSVFGGALSSSAWKSAGYANATKFPNVVPFQGTSASGDPTGLAGQGLHVLQDLDPLNAFSTGASLGGDAVKAATGGLANTILGPLINWVEAGAADVTFVGFGLLLVLIGLSITFKGEEEDAAPVAAAAAA